MSDFGDKTELSGHEVAESLVAKVGGLENLFTPDDPAPDPAPADTSTEEPAAEEASTETEEGTEPELVEDEHGNLRGPDGRFVAKEDRDDQTPEEEGTDEPEEPAAEEETGGDEVLEVDLSDEGVQAFLEKYDGDIGKALRGAAELQKMSGNQGNELGELRARFEQMEKMLPTLAQQATPAVDYGAAIDRVSEHEYADESQRSSAFSQLADHAIQARDYDSMAAVIAEWKDHDPFGASTFYNNVVNSFERAALVEQFEQQNATAQTATDNSEAVGQEVAKVVARHPDLEQHLEAIGKIAQERPYLGAALQEGSAQQRASALEDLYLLARSRDTDTSREALTKVQLKAQEESERARADAAVVSASRGTAASADQPTGVDAFKQAFLERTGQARDE